MASEIKFKSAECYSRKGKVIMELMPENSRQAETFCLEMKDKMYVAVIKEFREKRSIDANNYFWILCDQLSEKINKPKIEIYREQIKNIGGNSYMSPVLVTEKDKAINFWEHQGIGWVCDDTGSSKLKGCTNIIFYAGSSVYDTAQMSRLIELIVEECELQGIDTRTPEEIARMCNEWGS